MSASFSLEWKCPVASDLLIKYHNGWIMHDLMILVGIPSGPDDDFGLSLETVSVSSLSLFGLN